MLLTTEDYPPFSYEERQEQPALASSHAPSLGTAPPQPPETAQTPRPPAGEPP
jgi:hypothetical protein